MGRKTLSQAKNDIVTCFMEVVDPSPEKFELEEMKKYFDYKCAYCEFPLPPGDKKAHTDHLIPKSQGINHISNRVLACDNCNSHEKRESEWKGFVQIKAGEHSFRRIEKIESWIRQKSLSPEKIATVIRRRAAAKTMADEVCKLLTEKISQLKS